MSDFVTTPLENQYSSQIVGEISSGSTTPFNIEVKDAINFTPAAGGFYVVVEPGTSKEEGLLITSVSSTTWTVGTRGIAVAKGGTATTASHGGGSKIVITDHWKVFDDVATAIATKAEIGDNNTWTGTNTFEAATTFEAEVGINSTTIGGFRMNNVTTTQRDAIASPLNGMIVYNTTTGVMNQYIGGAWNTFATGSVSNAADNTAGKVDIASATEIGAGTATDASSGAINVIPVSQTAKTSSGTSDENKVPVLGAGGGVARGSTADFSGDGSDGALNVTASTTLATGLKQYTSITIDSGQTLTLTGTDTAAIWLCSGNVTINGIIDARALVTSPFGTAVDGALFGVMSGNARTAVTASSGGTGGTSVQGAGGAGGTSTTASGTPGVGGAGGATGVNAGTAGSDGNSAGGAGGGGGGGGQSGGGVTGSSNSGNNGGAGGAGGTGNPSGGGGGGGGGYDTGNGGAGGSAGSGSGATDGGDGGNSGVNGGAGGAGGAGVGGDGGVGADGYSSGGNGGNGGSNGGVGGAGGNSSYGSGGSGGTGGGTGTGTGGAGGDGTTGGAGGAGGNSSTSGAIGGAGGDGTTGASPVVILATGTMTFGASSSIKAAGGTGGAGGRGGNTSSATATDNGGTGGNGGRGGDGADVILMCRGTLTDSGINIDNSGGDGGAPGKGGDSSNSGSSLGINGNPGQRGRDGRKIFSKVV